MKDVLFSLLKKSAITPLVFIFILFLSGAYLQNRALTVQNRPIIVSIEKARKIETEEFIFDEVEISLSKSGSYSVASSLLDEQKNREALEQLDKFPDENKWKDLNFILLYSRVLIRLEEYDSALEILSAFTDDSGENASVFFSTGLVLNRLGDKSGAVYSYKKALELQPNFYEASFNLGNLYLALKRYNFAIATLEKNIYMAGGVKRSQSLNSLGKAYLRVGNYNQAETSFQESINLQPSSLKPRFGLANLYLESGKLKESEKILNEILKLDELNGQAYKTLADLSLQNEDTKTAIIYLEEAVAKSPHYDEARIQLAVLLFETNELERAIDSLLWIIENSFDLESAYFQLGRINYTQRDFVKASEYYLLSFSHSGESNVEALNNLGLSYRSMEKNDQSRAAFNQAILLKTMGRYSESEDSYLKAIKINPEEIKYWQNLSALLAELNRTEDAKIVLVEGIEVHPDSHILRFNLALQYKKLGDIQKFERELHRVVDLKPDYVKGWLALGELQSDKKNHIEALYSYRQAVKIDPDDGYTKYQMGKELFKLNRYEEALLSFSESVQFISDNAWIWYNLGMTQLQLGRNGEAEESFRASLRIDPQMVRFISNRYEREEDTIELLSEMIEQDPLNMALRIQLAELAARSGNFNLSRTQLERAIEIEPENEELWRTFLDIAEEQEDWSLVEKSYENILQLSPKDGELLFLYGKFLYYQDRREESFQVLEKAILVHNSPLELLQFYGNSLYDVKNYSKSSEILKMAVEIEPSMGPTVMDLGKAYYRNSEYDKAQFYFQKSINLMPHYAWAYVWTGRAMIKQELYDEAINIFKEAIILEPDFIQVYIGLGDLERSRNRNNEAAVYYRRVLELEPEHKGTLKKLKNLSNQF